MNKYAEHRRRQREKAEAKKAAAAKAKRDKAALARGPGALREEFGYPPFSVLDADSVWWRKRRRLWLSLGIKSERDAKSRTSMSE